MPLFFAKTKDELAAKVRRLSEPRAGGFVTFCGRVRQVNREKEVAFLTYEAHVELANALFADLKNEAIKRFGILAAFAAHRLGRVEVGDDAVVIEVGAPHRHEAFLAARFLMDELKKNLPIWKKEVYLDGSFSWDQGLCECGPKQEDAGDILRPVARALKEQQITLLDLEHKKILLVGAGGLGCPLAINLSALGIKHLAIYDGDVVDNSNLARQFVYKETDLGQKKAILLKRFIEERFRSSAVVAFASFLDERQAKETASCYDLVIDASDCRFTKSMLKTIAYEKAVPLISASVYQLEGELQIYQPQVVGACLNCFAGTTDSNTAGSCQSVGVLTHVCGMVAGLATDKALALLTGRLKSQCEMTIIEPSNGLIKTLAIAKDRDCAICGERRSIKTTKRLVRLAR